MKIDVEKEYKEYSSKIGNRKALYKAVMKEYDIKSCLYPGSHIDISPSLIIPFVTYVDNFKGAIKFFKETEQIINFVENNKEYKENATLNFFGTDYTDSLTIEAVDLIISQYAGFVGQATKKYLKVGGILLCNDSHGDASLANADDDFVLIGVLSSSNKIKVANLDKYFVMKNGGEIDLEYVKNKMRGLKYTVMVENYLFRKIK